MSARTNLVINDRATTPVAHTFSPDGTDVNGVHLFSEKTAVPAGNPRVGIKLGKKTNRYEPTVSVVVPIVQTQVINGVSSPVVVRTARARLDFTFDSLSTDQERKDVVAFMANTLAASQTQVNDLLVGLSDIY
jgi:hypothetical protein